MTMNRVVVTGIGIDSSIGIGAEAVINSLREACSGIVTAPEYVAHNFLCQVYGSVKGFDPLTVFPEKRQRRYMGEGRLLPLGYHAMQQAVADSGLEQQVLSSEMTGILVGTGGPSTFDQCAAAQTVLQALHDDEQKSESEKGKKSPMKLIGLYKVPPTMSSGLCALLATDFKINGIGFSITSACATSAHCVGEAWHMIRSGRQHVMFAGGAEDADWTKVQGFDAMGALSSKFNQTPATASRAYDKNRAGFVDAEGSGIIVLESLEFAKARGARIYAEVVGYGATSDGFSMVEPSGQGAIRSMQWALSTVHEDIDYINPHGTSTPKGDLKEIEAIREVFKDKIPPISSTKSLTGHSLGAAGVQEAIYSILMMNESFLCESAHIEEIDPDFADVPIIRKRMEGIKVDTVMSNSFGFGGTNATLVFQRYNG